MRFALSIFVILTFVLVGLLGVLFTQVGNDAIKPIIENKLSDKFGKKIILDRFSLRPSTISVMAKVDDAVLELEGELSIMSKIFDLNYKIEAQSIKTKNFIIKDRVSFGGRAKGNIKTMEIDGDGLALGTKTKFSIKIENNIPTKIIINSDNAKIEHLLALVNKPIYLTGLFDFNADINNFKTMDGKIEAKIKDATLQSQSLEKDFNITIPQNIQLNASLVSKLEENKIISIAKVKSDLVDIEADNCVLTYDVTNKYNNFTLNSDYKLFFPELMRLEKIANLNLNGNLEANGNIKILQNEAKSEVIIDGNTKKFDGNLDFILKNTMLDVSSKNNKLEKILGTIGYFAIAKGAVDGNISYDIKAKKGVVAAELSEGSILPNHFTDIIFVATGSDLAKERYNRSFFESNIDGDLVAFNIKAKSDKSNILFENGVYDRKNKTINSKFSINIDKKDLKGFVDGDIENPKIAIEESQYLKQKLSKEADKIIDKHFQSSEDAKEVVKGILNLIGK